MAVWRQCGRIFSRSLPILITSFWVGHAGLASAASQRIDQPASIVLEATTGRVLEQQDPDVLHRPASLAKLMTLYMTFEALRDRRISLDEAVPFSAHAASMIPTKLGVPPGGEVTVEQAILSMVTLSANDSAAAMGELLGGSEDRFAQMMTVRARALGMTHTVFQNASGLPAPDQWTTARDMAILARHLISDFPDDYHYFSTPSFAFHGRVIFNHDTELKSYPGADGMKTGYTIASGHNLVTSAMRNGMRLIGVALGEPSNGARDIRMTALLNSGYQDLGVPIGRGVTVASHLPRLIPTAQAAELVRPVISKVTVARPADPVTNDWAIQVGSYRSEKAARKAALRARHVTENGAPHVAHAAVRGRTSWRAQITGLTAPEAHDACNTLSRHRTPCMVIRADAGHDVARS